MDYNVGYQVSDSRIGSADWLITNLGTVMIDSLCSLAGFKQFEPRAKPITGAKAALTRG